MGAFQNYQATKKLEQLAKQPFDLTKEGNLTPERVAKMQTEALGFQYFYATQRITDEVLDTLISLSEEADVQKKLGQMQSGEIINKIDGIESENRMVLHTAMRDFFEESNSSPEAKKAAELAKKENEKLRTFIEEIDKSGKFTDLVQIGIGGSCLGPEAVYLALKVYEKPNRRVHFLSNVDPDDGARYFHQLDLSKTLFVSVSKSGGTLETLTNQEYVREQLKKAGLNPKDHLIAVTGQGSPMDDPSQYLHSFYMWDYVGGRYSVTSMVGAVMLSFAIGYDRWMEFLHGCSQMDKHALTASPRENLPLLDALFGIWNRNFLKYPTVAVIPYSQALCRFSAHLQQLDMESNGKRIDRQGNPIDCETGPIIWGEPGTNGQHSFYQCIHQGSSIIPLEFIGFFDNQYSLDTSFKGTTSQEKLLSNLFAQAIALATGQKSDNPNKQFLGNRPSSILFGQKLDPFTLGALLSYYENKVAFQGFIWNINSFDQEGVQLGKVLAMKIIDQFSLLNEGKPIDESAFPLGAAYLKAICGKEGMSPGKKFKKAS